MINQQGIEVNLNKILALIKMWSPSKPKEVQSLMESVATLNIYVS